jgi:hypothetical protein
VTDDAQLFSVSAQIVDVVPQPRYGPTDLLDYLRYANSGAKVVVDSYERHTILNKRFRKKAVRGFIASLPVAAVNKNRRGRGLRLSSREIV